jgi:hypothetical protein
MPRFILQKKRRHRDNLFVLPATVDPAREPTERHNATDLVSGIRRKRSPQEVCDSPGTIACIALDRSSHINTPACLDTTAAQEN